MRGIFYDGPPTEFLGEPGDVLLWHHLLSHSASANANRGRPRIGLFCTWHHEGIWAAPGVTLEALEAEPAAEQRARRRRERRCRVLEDLWADWSAQTRAGGRPAARL
jgi:ectoine hydroxylase-related dioxygenase (phytanoyl-CoA dioxygenase family)